MYESDVHASPNPAGESSVKAKFPEGLRVLVVDDNMVCLKLIAALLNKCRYKVTATTKAKEALEMLRKNKESYDIVITDVIMLDMDGFELLEIIGLEMDMPVIMMSANDDKESVMKGVKHGARDYLLKPVRLEEVKNIWQHVVRKNLFNPTKTGTAKGGTDQNLMPSKRQRDKSKEEEEEEDDETNTQSNGESSAHKKKKRVVWTKVLHNKFVDAVRQLEVDKAVPKKILEIMNEPEISRENVASHLQKYRNALRKESRNAKISQESENNINPNKENEILSDTMTASSINQGLNIVNRHNRFAEQGGMSGFGSRLQMFGASTSNTKLQKNLLPPQVADQMRTTMLGSAPPAPFFGANLSPQPELNGMRFHSIHSRTKMVDDNVGISSSHLPSFKVGQPGPSSLPVGFGPCSCPPAAFNLADLPFQMLGDTSTQLNPISQADSLATMLPWQHEGRNLAYLNGKGETTSFPFDMRGQITDESTQKGQFVQHRYPFESTEREGNGHHINSSSSPDDDLLSIMVKQFSSNSAPRL